MRTVRYYSIKLFKIDITVSITISLPDHFLNVFLFPLQVIRNDRSSESLDGYFASFLVIKEIKHLLDLVSALISTNSRS